MRIVGIVTAAIAGSLALTACNQPKTQAQTGGTKPAAQPGGTRYFGKGSIPIVDCDASVPRPAADEKYVLTLSESFTIRDAQADKSGHAQPANPHPKTRLDITTDLKEGQSAIIRVVLTDPLLTFQDKDVALRGGDDNAPLIFCGLDWNPGRKEISFTVHRDRGGPTRASYNLGLNVTDGSNSSLSLPVFIDPDVTNEG